MLVRLLLFCCGIFFTAGQTVMVIHGSHKHRMNTTRLDTKGRDFKNSAKFTDFIHEAIQILNTYEDNDLEKFFSVFNSEIRKYHYRGCKFHELIENANLKKFIAHRLQFLSEIGAAEIRTLLTAISNKFKLKSYNKHEKELIDLINSLYRDNAVDSFRTVLNNIEQYKNLKSRKGANPLIDIIAAGLRSTVFDYYTDLNRNAKITLKTKLDELWTDFIEYTTSQLLTSFFDGSEYNLLRAETEKPNDNKNKTIDKEKKDVDDETKIEKEDDTDDFITKLSHNSKKTHSGSHVTTLTDATTQESKDQGSLKTTNTHTSTMEQSITENTNVHTLYLEYISTKPHTGSKHRLHNLKPSTHLQKVFNRMTTTRHIPIVRGTTNDNKRDTVTSLPSAEHTRSKEGLSIEIFVTKEDNLNNITQNYSEPRAVVNFF